MATKITFHPQHAQIFDDGMIIHSTSLQNIFDKIDDIMGKDKSNVEKKSMDIIKDILLGMIGNVDCDEHILLNTMDMEVGEQMAEDMSVAQNVATYCCPEVFYNFIESLIMVGGDYIRITNNK